MSSGWRDGLDVFVDGLKGPIGIIVMAVVALLSLLAFTKSWAALALGAYLFAGSIAPCWFIGTVSRDPVMFGRIKSTEVVTGLWIWLWPIPLTQLVIRSVRERGVRS